MGVSKNLNEAAYARLRSGIDIKYPRGQYVAIADGQIAGDAAAFDELLASLRQRGLEPYNVLVVQAGIEPLTEAIILLAAKGA